MIIILAVIVASWLISLDISSGEYHDFRSGRRCARCTASLRTKIMDFRGFDSSGILISRGGIVLMSTGNFPESLSQRILAGTILVGGLGSLDCAAGTRSKRKGDDSGNRVPGRRSAWQLDSQAHRLPDGVGIDEVFTEGQHFPTCCHGLFLSAHVLPHFVIFCNSSPAFSREVLLEGVAALLRRPRLEAGDRRYNSYNSYDSQAASPAARQAALPAASQRESPQAIR